MCDPVIDTQGNILILKTKMKKNQILIVVIIIIILAAIASACGHQTPVFNCVDHPFIVDKIEADYKLPGYATYQSERRTGYINVWSNVWAPNNATVSLPNGWFSVGDTIRF